MRLHAVAACASCVTAEHPVAMSGAACCPMMRAACCVHAARHDLPAHCLARRGARHERAVRAQPDGRVLQVLVLAQGDAAAACNDGAAAACKGVQL